jgi:DNA mismatch endonuclease (patch repair protein)
MDYRETELNMVTKPDPQNLTAPVSEMRSRIMRAVPRANTRPEILVRKLLHGLGLRFRIQQKALAGTPDIVLPKHRTAIFVHGCFWHRHADCSKATTPKTRAEFWQAKFDRNKDRDQENERTLVAAGWRVVTVWECETRKPQALADRLRATFGLNALVD